MSYKLAAIDPEARIQVHWATQILAAAADAFVDHRDDDSHSNLGWDPSRRALVGQAEFSLHLDDFVLVDERSGDTLELVGASLGDGLTWCQQARHAPEPLAPRDYDMPSHPVATGARLSDISSSALAGLGNWFQCASEVLGDLSAVYGSSPVRCWPHHFDIATLITLVASDEPESAITVGVGLSPGDQHYQQPYWYVSPYPPPDGALPALPKPAHWHRDGFVAAILDRPTDRETIDGVLHEAVKASRAVLGQ